MIICKECGFESNRLQWTHFKYNCTGRFKNGKEYQKVYPGAPLVDSEISKKTAVTLNNLISKYGEVEGAGRWNAYREKQAYSNSFEYKSEKYNWDELEFQKFNKSRAVTLENMVKKHGEELGLKKWNNYCDQQKYTKSKEYLISKYGEELGNQKHFEILAKKREPHDPTLLSEKLGISIDQAIQIICSRGSYKYTSLLEKEFVKHIESIIGPLEHTSFNQPFGKWAKLLDKYVVYDIKHKDCIIEFNGDYWHANPKKYTENDTIRGNKVTDIWEHDVKKLNEAAAAGYRTMVVWESDYLENTQQTIEKVVKWILNDKK